MHNKLDVYIVVMVEDLKPAFIAAITTQRGFSHPLGVPGSRREVNEEFQQAKRECCGISVLSFEEPWRLFSPLVRGWKN